MPATRTYYITMSTNHWPLMDEPLRPAWADPYTDDHGTKEWLFPDPAPAANFDSGLFHNIGVSPSGLSPEYTANASSRQLPGSDALPSPDLANPYQAAVPAPGGKSNFRLEPGANITTQLAPAPVAVKAETRLRNQYHTAGVPPVSPLLSAELQQAAVTPPQAGDRTTRKRPRRKTLDDVEAALIEKDDALLTEEELTIKKKAQNRLAQRAFRERKETKLKELETRLLHSETERQMLLEQLEQIRSLFVLVHTQNERLRMSHNGGLDQEPLVSFPRTQKAFVEHMTKGKAHKVSGDTMNKVYDEPLKPGLKMLGVGAVWDYLQIKREEEKYEDIDMLEVMDLLKGSELCHGFGPAYLLLFVDSTLEQVAAKYS